MQSRCEIITSEPISYYATMNGGVSSGYVGGTVNKQILGQLGRRWAVAWAKESAQIIAYFG